MITLAAVIPSRVPGQLLEIRTEDSILELMINICKQKQPLTILTSLDLSTQVYLSTYKHHAPIAITFSDQGRKYRRPKILIVGQGSIHTLEIANSNLKALGNLMNKGRNAKYATINSTS